MAAVSEPTSVRVRIAPSPTGFAHLGTASTALYNVLFARQLQGTFTLRIDDTDVERNRPEYEQLIYEALHWLGLDWDEGPDKGGPYAPYRQSERVDLYKQHAVKLLADGKAYKCYCTPEELEAERRQAQAEKRPYKYSRRCLIDPHKDRTEFTVRFKVPGGEIKFTDMIRGEMTFDADLIGDFILVKSDGFPTYQFASPVDDATMNISHVIRGEEHLSNTPYQLMIVDALGYKRPDAYYLALLGWNPGTAQEIFTFDELVRVFSFDRVQHAGARFDWEKLNWINGEWIRAMDDAELAKRLEPFLPSLDEATITRAVPPLKTRMAKLADATEYLDYLWQDPEPPALDPDSIERLKLAAEAIKDVAWQPDPIEHALEEVVTRTDISKNKLYTPIRLALTGKKVSLPIHYTLVLLPKEVAMARINKAIQ